MADLKTAVDFDLKQEDAKLAGVVTHTPGDPGGTTRFGLAERWHPELVKTGFFDPARMNTVDARAIAEQTYVAQYAAPLQLYEIDSQDIANRLLSFAVNEGPEEAVRIFQRALARVEHGFIGARTESSARTPCGRSTAPTRSSCACR